jgi:hypothetical protein
MRSAVSDSVFGVTREKTGHAWRNWQIIADSLAQTTAAGTSTTVMSSVGNIGEAEATAFT